MTTFNNLYIDEVRIRSNNGSKFAGIQTQIYGEDVDSSVTTVEGYEWIVQLANGTNSAINFDSGSNKLRLQWCTNYKNDEGNADSQKDVNYDITSGSIAAGNDSNNQVGSFWIGFEASDAAEDAGESSAYHNVSGNPNYVAAQRATVSGTSRIIVAPRVKLYLGDVLLDIAGVNTQDGTSAWFTNSVVDVITEELNAQDGSLRRRHQTDTGSSVGTIPTTTYTSTQWRISANQYLFYNAYGDPHIKTLRGEHYEFDYLGAFRMFEYSKNGNFMLINGLAETGPGRWKNKQYIRKLFIQNNNAKILLDMGFRGSPVKVLENNGITYKERSLSFDAEAKRYNFDNTLSTLDLNAPITENLPGLVRNQIDIILDINNVGGNEFDNDELTFLSLQNVNEFNLQPCRLNVKMSNRLIDAAKGCLIDRKYAPVAKLDNITDITPLEEPTLEDLKHIPELEIAPRLRNRKWK
tara:strand:+ start:2634 stop:4028 length:1395 start_codon:yes stop_codon:yes gene_type:complete